MPHRILIIDDERHMCLSLSKLLRAHGYDTSFETDTELALAAVKRSSFDLIITDLKLPGMTGIEFINAVKALKLPVPMIMISGYASVENVVEAMRCGAMNFYPKPLNTEALLKEIHQITDVRKPSGHEEYKIITENRQMKDILHSAGMAASTDAPVIITGESGTGKELFAAYIHRMSKRKDAPYIKINCAAIPESLMESELFGHAKGAFTDAREGRKGKFEIAEGGTVFFDEIGEMNVKTQAKLLRVLQEKEFERVGSNDIRRMNVRFIAATNRDLPSMIRDGEFREDLYYRLNVVNLNIPPLREHKEDIIPLARYFLDQNNIVYNRKIKDLSEETVTSFLKHDWPGNVRELKNTVERAVIFCDGETLQVDHLPQSYRQIYTPGETDLKTLKEKVTREVILDALEKTGGSRQKAAEVLNINRRTLYNKMKALGLLNHDS